MKIKHLTRPSCRAWSLPALTFAAVLLAAMAASCGGGGTSTGTATPAATGSLPATGTPGTGLYGAAARQATIKPGPTPGITDTEIVLGADTILSGTLSAVYATLPQATKAYFDYINDTEGGVCGRKIVYTVEDNFTDPARSLEAVRRLVEQDKVFAMVGSLGDVPHAGSWDWLNQNGVPDLLVSAGSARFGADPSGHPWEVQMIPSYTIDATFLGQYISEYQPGKTVAVLWEDDSVGIDGFAGLRQGIDPSKNQIVADKSYEVTDISVASQMAILKKSNAEVVVAFSTPAVIAQAIKGADRLGWHPQFVMPYINNDDMMFQFSTPKLMEGAVTTNANKQASMKDDPAVAAFLNIQKDYGGPPATNFTLYAQILGELAVDILNRSCGDLTREGVMETVESIKNWHSDLMLDGVTFSFSPTDHVAYQSGIFMQAKVDASGKGYWDYFGELRQFEGIS